MSKILIDSPPSRSSEKTSFFLFLSHSLARSLMRMYTRHARRHVRIDDVTSRLSCFAFVRTSPNANLLPLRWSRQSLIQWKNSKIGDSSATIVQFIFVRILREKSREYFLAIVCIWWALNILYILICKVLKSCQPRYMLHLCFFTHLSRCSKVETTPRKKRKFNSKYYLFSNFSRKCPIF